MRSLDGPVLGVGGKDVETGESFAPPSAYNPRLKKVIEKIQAGPKRIHYTPKSVRQCSKYKDVSAWNNIGNADSEAFLTNFYYCIKKYGSRNKGSQNVPKAKRKILWFH